MIRAFISHKSEDSQVAEEIGSYLREKGIDVWLDTWRIGYADSIVQSVNRGLESSDVMVVLLSQKSIESRWVEKEWNAKFSDELRTGKNIVIPVCIELPENLRIPALLRDKKYISILPNNWKNGLLRLAATILKASMPVGVDLPRVFLLGYYAIQLASLSVLHKNTANYATMKRELERMISDLGLRNLGCWETNYSLQSLELFLDGVKPFGALAEAAYMLGYSDMSLIYTIERDDLSDQARQEVLGKLLDQIEESLTLLSLHQWFVDYKRVVNDVLNGETAQRARSRIEGFRPNLFKDLKLCGAR